MYPFYIVLVVCYFCAAASSLIIKELYRSIDISTQLVEVRLNITLWNEQEVSLDKFQFLTDPYQNGTLSYIEARSENALKIIKEKSHWQVILNNKLHPGEQAMLFVNYVFIHQLIPYPTHIKQNETQLVLFNGNVYFYSPYFIEKQVTLVLIPSERIESYDHYEQTNIFEKFLAYGPYTKVVPYSFQEMKIHYENNAPFLVITNLKRDIQVSHWGNIAIEDYIELEHRGAVLTGPFSRYDYQVNPQRRFSSIWQYVTVLPPSAKDIYYKDLIGNVSSSQVRYYNDFVQLMLQLRFPLFGGWKINYIVGYNLPSYEYLYRDGNNLLLRMNIMDHIFKHMVVEKMQARVVFPEYSANLNISTQCAVGNFSMGKHYTYLDVVGRPTIQFTGFNLVANHINTFDVHYSFPFKVMLLEPMYLCIAIFLVFSIIIFITHLLHFEGDRREEIVKRKKRYRRKVK